MCAKPDRRSSPGEREVALPRAPLTRLVAVFVAFAREDTDTTERFSSTRPDCFGYGLSLAS